MDLLVTAAMLARTDIEALDRTVRFLLGFLAAVPGLIEERVIHVLRNKCEGVLLSLRLCPGAERKQAAIPGDAES